MCVIFVIPMFNVSWRFSRLLIPLLAPQRLTVSWRCRNRLRTCIFHSTVLGVRSLGSFIAFISSYIGSADHPDNLLWESVLGRRLLAGLAVFPPFPSDMYARIVLLPCPPIGVAEIRES